MKSLVEKYQNITTPAELLEFMNEHFSYGYLGKDGRVFVPIDSDFDDSWCLNYQLQSVNDILQTRVGNCFDMVEFEREWFSNHGYQTKTFFEMVLLDYDNSYSMHAFLVYKENNSWFLFEFSDFMHRGIFRFSNLKELLKYQRNNYISILKSQDIKENELEKMIVKEFMHPKAGISASEYLDYVLLGNFVRTERNKS